MHTYSSRLAHNDVILNERQRFSFVCYDGHCLILGHRVRKTNYPSHFETCCHGSLSHLLPIYVVVHLRVGNVLEFDVFMYCLSNNSFVSLT